MSLSVLLAFRGESSYQKTHVSARNMVGGSKRVGEGLLGVDIGRLSPPSSARLPMPSLMEAPWSLITGTNSMYTQERGGGE